MATTTQRRRTHALGTSTAAASETSAARQARIWRETLRDLMARKSGYLLAHRYLDAAMADAQGAHYAQDRDAAQVLGAVLSVRHLLDAEMERVDAQMRLVELLRETSDAA